METIMAKGECDKHAHHKGKHPQERHRQKDPSQSTPHAHGRRFLFEEKPWARVTAVVVTAIVGENGYDGLGESNWRRWTMVQITSVPVLIINTAAPLLTPKPATPIVRTIMTRFAFTGNPCPGTNLVVVVVCGIRVGQFIVTR
jgi:hypothetical protein